MDFPGCIASCPQKADRTFDNENINICYLLNQNKWYLGAADTVLNSLTVITIRLKDQPLSGTFLPAPRLTEDPGFHSPNQKHTSPPEEPLYKVLITGNDLLLMVLTSTSSLHPA